MEREFKLTDNQRLTKGSGVASFHLKQLRAIGETAVLIEKKKSLLQVFSF